jgi:hypothetical protein
VQRARHPSAESAAAINALASFRASADVMIGPDVVPTRHPRCSVTLGRLASRASLPPRPTTRPPGSRRSVSPSLLSISPSLVKCCRNEINHAEMIVHEPPPAHLEHPRMPPGGRGVPHPAGLGVLPGDGPLGGHGEMVSAPHRLLSAQALGAHWHLGARCLAPPGRDGEG